MATKRPKSSASIVVLAWISLGVVSHADKTPNMQPTTSVIVGQQTKSRALSDPYGLDSRLPANRRQPLNELRLPWPDVLESSMQRLNLPEQEIRQSVWHDAETKLFADLLAAGTFDVLVVPFQTQHFGLDRIARSIMTADLAYAAAAGGSRVADPYLVARALGDGLRRIPPADVLKLARRIGVKVIVWGYVGHGRDRKLKITMRTSKYDATTGSLGKASRKQRDWTEITFSDEDPPVAVFHRMLPEIMDAVTLPCRVSVVPSVAVPGQTLAVPAEPHALVAGGATGPLSAAAALELLGALAPLENPRSREKLHERAWLALADVSADSSYTRVLRARVLHGLYRRPAALQALGDGQEPAVAALRAILNGNLPAAERATAVIDDEYLRMLAELELAALSSHYQVERPRALPAQVEVVAQRSAEWRGLLGRHWRENDVWAADNNTVIKQLLDAAYPVAGLGLEAIVAGQLVIGQGERVPREIDMSVVRHIRKLLTDDPQKWCCAVAQIGTREQDYLGLLEALGEATLLKNIWREAKYRGRPQRALAMLAEYGDVYAGHPEFDSLYASTELRQAETRPVAERAAVLQSAHRHAVSALYREQGQSAAAWRAAVSLGVPSRDSSPFIEAYVRDYPMRPYWYVYEPLGLDGIDWTAANSLAAIAFSTADFQPIAKALRGRDPVLREEAERAMKGRFAGNPDAIDVIAQLHSSRGESSEVERTYRNAVQTQPDVWQHYADLGRFLVEDRGDYAAAAALFERYPGFQVARPGDSVALSNQAHNAGSLLYWRGALPEAQRLYEISARYDNGSEASITSALRLDLLAGRYVDATRRSLERANRYNSPFAYRDYLSMLHVMGFADAASAGFAQLADKFQNPQVWLSMLVGQRVAGLGAAEFKTWVLQEDIRNASFRRQKLALGYTLLWNLVDREPMPDLAKLLADIEGEPLSYIDVDGRTLLRPHPMSDKGGFGAYHPSQFRAQSRTPVAPGIKIPSGLIFFADAYLALKQGTYADAVTKFDLLAERYAIEAEDADMAFALPYFAYASAKSGDPLGLEVYLETLPPPQRRFDFDLAMALFTGLDGNVEGALDHLKRAFNRRPHTNARPVLTEYQYAEVCEWLLRETGAEQYRELILDWARKFQRIQGEYAWAWVMDARWSRTVEERALVLPMALYLDRNSVRLKELDAGELDTARVRATDNPFLDAGKQLQEETTATGA